MFGLVEYYREAATCFQQLLRVPGAAKKDMSAGSRQWVQLRLRDAITSDTQSRLPRRITWTLWRCVRSAGDMGRRLFVTRDVHEGELLLVSDALAVVPAQQGASDPDTRVVVRLMKSLVLAMVVLHLKKTARQWSRTPPDPPQLQLWPMTAETSTRIRRLSDPKRRTRS